MDETGRNSVTPCTTPSSAAARRFTRAKRMVYDARAFRCLDCARRLRRRRGDRRRRMRGGARRALAAPEAHDGRGDEDARVGARDDAHDHREREPVQHFSAEEEQRQRGHQRRAGR